MSSTFTCCHGKSIQPGKSWIDKNGVQHPPNWDLWSGPQRTAAGITEVVQQAAPDSRLYVWSHNADGTVTSTAKDLADSGSGDSLVLGVKSVLKNEVKSQQHSRLSRNDWVITRKADKGTAIPSNVQTWRDATRAKGDEMEAAIDGAANTAAINSLFVVQDSDGNVESGILYDWPELG
jgi:hypothetical protein